MADGGCDPCAGVGVNGSSGAPGGGAPSVVFSDLIDFRAQTQGNVTLGNNVYTTQRGVSLTWTGQNTGAAATNFDITAAGLRMTLNAVNSAFTEVAQTGMGLWIPLSSMYTAYASQMWDASCDFLVQIYCSTVSFLANTTAPEGLKLGLWGVAGSPSNSANRLLATIRSRQGGVDCMSSIVGGGAGSNYTTAPAGTSNVVGLDTMGGNGQCLGGVWGGSWTTSPLVIEANARIGTATTNSSFRDQNNRLVIAMSSGNVASNGSSVVVEQIRWDVRRTR